MLRHPFEALAQTFGGDDGVRVEDKRVGAFRLHNGLVVGAGKPHILLVLNKGDTGEFWLNVWHGVVGGIVVNHDDFARQSLERFLG